MLVGYVNIIMLLLGNQPGLINRAIKSVAWLLVHLIKSVLFITFFINGCVDVPLYYESNQGSLYHIYVYPAVCFSLSICSTLLYTYNIALIIMIRLLSFRANRPCGL